MNKQTRRVVALCGYPCSGKSEVAHFLVEELGFLRTSADDRRAMIFGPGLGHVTNDEEWLRDYNLSIVGMVDDRNRCLKYGDVVMDSTNMSQKTRDLLFHPYTPCPTENFLLHLNVEKGVIEQRQRTKGRKIEFLAYYFNEFEPVVEGDNYILLRYPNNIPEERDVMLDDLRKRFQRPKESPIWTP